MHANCSEKFEPRLATLAAFRTVVFIENSIEAVRTYLRRRRTLAELRALDEHQLADIGLSGVDLDAFVRNRMR